MTNFSLSPAEVTGITALIIWELAWKGLALWKAAKRNDKIWYIVLLIINTAGILEILYIFVFSRREDKAKKNA